MIRRSLEMIVSRGEDGSILLKSPAVGVYTDAPRAGEGLVPGSSAGTLVVLGRNVDLLVPEGAEGHVAQVRVDDRASPVAYAQTLIVLSIEAVRTQASGSNERDATGASASRAPKGEGPRGRSRTGAGTGKASVRGWDRDEPGAQEPRTYSLRAPTTGIFYARPDASSQPFVTEGTRLETGQTAGLIEVMKCFSPIVHPGGALPSPVVVEKVCVQEGEEVHPGQILFVLRPAPA